MDSDVYVSRLKRVSRIYWPDAEVGTKMTGIGVFFPEPQGPKSSWAMIVASGTWMFAKCRDRV